MPGHRLGTRLAGSAAVAGAAGAALVWQRRLRRSGTLADFPHLLMGGRETGTVPPGGVRVTSLGTTMMLIDDGVTQIVIDPFLTPVPLLAAALRTPVATDPRVVDDALDQVGADRVRAIFVSHAHHDHALDVAHLAHRTGATVYGSASTLNLARGGAVPEDQLSGLDPTRPVTVGGFTVRTFASRHSPHPLGGEGATIDRPLPQPAPITAYKEGGTYDFLVSARAQRMLFKGSVNWVPGAFDDVVADTLFLSVGTLGRVDKTFARDYLDATLGTLRPELAVLTHWNDLFAPVASPLPFHRKFIDDTPLSFERVRRHSHGARVGVLDAFTSITLTPSADLRTGP